MRVMCIYGGPWYEHRSGKVWLANYPAPPYGEVCVVIDEQEPGFKLEEYPLPSDLFWDKSKFIPCSEMDETEMVRENLLEEVI